jgi:hypothetical protein
LESEGRARWYVQIWGNLSHVVVLGGRHLVPSDQALSSQAMIEDWFWSIESQAANWLIHKTQVPKPLNSR